MASGFRPLRQPRPDPGARARLSMSDLQPGLVTVAELGSRAATKNNREGRSLTVAAPIARRSARKAKGDGHLRRAEILEAAERIFVAEGYEGATIRKIADEVGVSSTALYMHFPDKGCILAEICERTFENLLARNSEIAQKPLDAVVRTRMMLDAYMRWGLG